MFLAFLCCGIYPHVALKDNGPSCPFTYCSHHDLLPLRFKLTVEIMILIHLFLHIMATAGAVASRMAQPQPHTATDAASSMAQPHAATNAKPQPESLKLTVAIENARKASEISSCYAATATIKFALSLMHLTDSENTTLPWTLIDAAIVAAETAHTHAEAAHMSMRRATKAARAAATAAASAGHVPTAAACGETTACATGETRDGSTAGAGQTRALIAEAIARHGAASSAAPHPAAKDPAAKDADKLLVARSAFEQTQMAANQAAAKKHHQLRLVALRQHGADNVMLGHLVAASHDELLRVKNRNRQEQVAATIASNRAAATAAATVVPTAAAASQTTAAATVETTADTDPTAAAAAASAATPAADVAATQSAANQAAATCPVRTVRTPKQPPGPPPPRAAATKPRQPPGPPPPSVFAVHGCVPKHTVAVPKIVSAKRPHVISAGHSPFRMVMPRRTN